METTTESPKVCRHGGHVIDEQRGWVTHVQTDDKGERTRPDEYSCTFHDDLKRVEEYERTRVLRTGLITLAVLEQDRRRRALGLRYDDVYAPTIKLWFDHFMADLERVNVAAKVWEREVWFGGETPDSDPKRVEPYSENMPDTLAYKRDAKGKIKLKHVPKRSLQAFVLPAQYKGYRCDVDGLTYLSYTMCGRSIFQIDDDANGTSVGIILDEDSPTARGGIKSIDATADQAVDLIERAVANWKAGRIVLVHQNGVGFGF